MNAEHHYRARRAAATTLAGRLRDIAEALVTCDPAVEDLEAANRLAAELRPHLDGPARVRWHQADPDQGDDAPIEHRNAWVDASPFVGVIHPSAPPMRVRRVTAADADGRPQLEGRVRVGPVYEGPPGGVHGGMMAGLFDELLGATPSGLLGVPAVTGRLKLRYVALTPIDQDLRLTAWIDSHRGRRIVARGACHVDDRLTAEAEGLLVRVAFAASGP